MRTYVQVCVEANSVNTIYLKLKILHISGSHGCEDVSVDLLGCNAL
jgi:hypothetical protein